MIAADTSSLVAYFAGDSGPDVEAVDASLAGWRLVLPAVVLTELLSEPRLPRRVSDQILQLPVLTVDDGYWRRAGLLRAKVLAGKWKSRVADALIAQSCIDHRVPLVTRDRDFRHYERLGGLVLAP